VSDFKVGEHVPVKLSGGVAFDCKSVFQEENSLDEIICAMVFVRIPGRKLADFVKGFKTKELAEKARLKISRKCASEDRNRRSSRNQ